MIAALFALAQPATNIQVQAHPDGIMIPSWVLGVVGALIMLLLGIVGFMVAFGIYTIRDVITSLHSAIKELNKTLTEYKEKAPEIFVPHDLFQMAQEKNTEDHEELANKIGAAESRLRESWKEHISMCPTKRFPPPVPPGGASAAHT